MLVFLTLIWVVHFGFMNFFEEENPKFSPAGGTVTKNNAAHIHEHKQPNAGDLPPLLLLLLTNTNISCSELL